MRRYTPQKPSGTSDVLCRVVRRGSSGMEIKYLALRSFSIFSWWGGAIVHTHYSARECLRSDFVADEDAAAPTGVPLAPHEGYCPVWVHAVWV